MAKTLNKTKILYMQIAGQPLFTINKMLNREKYEIYSVTVEKETVNFRKETARAIAAVIESKEIQCVISGGFAENIAQACFETGIPYIVIESKKKYETASYFMQYPCNYIWEPDDSLMRIFEERVEEVLREVNDRKETYIEEQRRLVMQKANTLLAEKKEDAYESLLVLLQDKQYETMLRKTTELGLLREMTECWQKESANGISHLFDEIDHLQQVYEAYLTIKHGMWRIEQGLSEEACLEIVEWLYQKKQYKFLAVWIIYANLRERERVMAQLGAFMKGYNVADAIEILSYGLLYYPHSQMILLQKAECLMDLNMWKEVLDTLYLIENPDISVRVTIQELENALQ